MIHGVYANHESFQSVTFTEGLNVILADRVETSTEKDTRNGLGKSTLIRIIDFCLGSQDSKGKGLLIEPLAEWAFTLEITLCGSRVKVTREVENPNRVVIEGETDGWPGQPESYGKPGKRVLRIEKWREFLGHALFGLSVSEDREKHRYRPSYRSLVPYLIRYGAGAYASPFEHFSKQRTWQAQLGVGYLLGMNWEYASRFQELKDREEDIRRLEKVVKAGELRDIFGTVGELETLSINLGRRTEEAKRALDSFKVHPQYESIQRDADSLTREIHDLSNSNVADRRLLERYKESVKEEVPPPETSLESLYEESDIAFSDGTRRTLAEARTFHNQIISNRRKFLEVEIKRLREEIDERESRVRELTDRRAEVLQILKTHGALDEMTLLQERFVALKEELDGVNARLEKTKSLETGRRKVRAEKVELVQTAQQDHEQRRDVWSTAVLLFDKHSKSLYETPGKLVIDLTETGYKYRVDIHRSGSEGIDKMKIFCFDLAVLQLQIQAGRGADFLIHDTLMYDSVDTRQRARALELAHEATSDLGGQYICTMNSDMIPSDYFSRGFDFDRYVRLTLSDAEPSGSLLGMRFERPESDPIEKSS